MPVTEDRHIYQVEVDISDVDASIEALRKKLGRALQIEAPADAVKEMAAPAEKAADAIERISKIDTSKSTQELVADLQKAQKIIAGIDDTLNRMSFTGRSGSGRLTTQVSEAYDRIERLYGREARNRLQGQGRLPDIGSLTAERTTAFEEASLGTEGKYKAIADVQEKARLSAEELREQSRLMAELYEAQITAAQTNAEIAKREITEIEEAQSEIIQAGAGQDPADVAAAVAGLDEAWNEANERLQANMREEQQLAADLVDLRQRQRQELERAQQQAAALEAKSKGQIVGSGAGTGSTVNQTALVVRKGSVENAERLAKAMEEAATAARKMQEYNNKGIDEQRRRDELQLVRDRLKLEQESAKAVEETAAKERKAIAATVAAEERKTEEVKQENRERLAAINQRYKLEQEEARQNTKRIAEQERRITQQQRAEAQRRQTGVGGAAGGIPVGRLATGAAAAVGVYSLDQVLREFYGEGRLGAQQLRTAETFDFLAERAQVSADRMIAAINEASAGTIDDMTAISLSAQILSQRFAQTSDDIVGDTATLVKASRRLAQIYTDEQGNFLSTQEVFSRLIKFVREGNKELVDQFGLSNDRIAATLDITKDGLAGAEGAALRYQGVVQILTEDLDRLGDAQDGYADRIEASEARITNARNRIRQALAPAVAEVSESVASRVDRLAVFTGLNDDLAILVRLLKETEEIASSSWIDNLFGMAEENASRVRQLTGALEQAQDAVAAGEEGAEEYAAALAELAKAAIRQDGLTAAQIETLYQLTEAYQIAAFAARGLANAEASRPGFGINGTGLTADDLRSRVTTGTGGFPGYDDEGARQQELFNQSKALNEARIQNIYKEREEAKKAQERLAKDAAREWERAAKAAAAAFESELRSVAGLFGTSDVTEEDLKLAELGLYQEKPDEYLRQLRDEVRNGKDYAGVSIEDAAARLGIDPAQEAEAILAQFEQAWNDSSLFAGGENLDLINKEAVQRELQRIEDSKSGQQAILEYFGITTAQTGTAAIASAAGAAILDGVGQAGTGATATGDGTTAAVVEAGTLQVSAIKASPETIEAFLTQIAGTISATGSQAEIGHIIRADILAGMAGAGLDEETTPVAAFVDAIRADMDAGDSATDIVAKARGIGLQMQNYIGAGLIDFADQQPTLAGVFAQQLKVSFLHADVQEKLGGIAGDLRGAIAMGWMDTSTLPDFAGSLANGIQGQLYQEQTTARVQALGAIMISMVWAGWAAGAADLDWLNPILSAAQTQAEEAEEAATLSSYEATAY